ncbi:MAG: patatin-like phospholipase family protein [Pseudomonadota bacterium]
MGRPRIGLALGSGGVRGWCHIGVLRALKEMGIEPDVIAGTSVGAVVGGIFAGGRLDALEAFARGLTRRKMVSLLDVRLSSGGLLDGREILKVFRAFDLPERIEDLPIPFAAVAADLQNGREIWLREGELLPALRASMALPGVVSPWNVGGRWLVDGGVINPVPISAARACGADVVIAVNPNARLDGAFWRPEQGATDQQAGRLVRFILSRDLLARRLLPIGAMLGGLLRSEKGEVPEDEEEPQNATKRPQYLDVISTSIDMMTEQIRRTRLAGEPPHVLLNAHLTRMSVLDFHRGREAVDEGWEMVQRQREAIERVCQI